MMKKLWDAIWYNGGRGPETGNNYWRRVVPIHYVWVGFWLTLMGVGVGLTVLIVGAVYPGLTGSDFQWSYFSEPLILFLNVLPVLLLTAFFYFATGRAWAAFLGAALPALGLAVAGLYKVSIRGEILNASDLGLIGEAMGILSNYTLRFSGRPRLALGVLVLGLLFSVFALRGRLKSRPVRLIGTAVTALAIGILLPTVYFSDTAAASLTNRKAEINPWVDQQVYVSRGFLYSFLHSVPDAFPQKPAGYDEDRAAGALGGYTDGSIDEDVRVNVIAVMFEAYTDLSEYPRIGVHEDVYAPLHELQRESLHGHVVANVFGGGTVDTERDFLTGYPDSEEYRVPTDSYVWFLRQNGYYAEGYHAGDPWFYNRKNVEMNLGLENYYFLDDYDVFDRSDEAFFERLGELIDARDKSVPYFNFSVTYQNHGAYIDTSTGDTAYLEREGKDDATYFDVNNYLTGIADTSRRMLDFVNSLRDDPEPFVVVFFGDHKPFLGDSYANMGVDMDLGTREGFYTYYTTPYIIWANDAAKKATGGDFTGEGGDVSACFLMDKVFEECGWGRSAYAQLVHDTSESVSVIHSGLDVAVEDGELLYASAGRRSEAADLLRWAAYYQKRRFSYGELLED